MKKEKVRLVGTPLQECIVRIARETRGKVSRAEIARRAASAMGTDCSRSYVSKVLDWEGISPVRPDDIAPRAWSKLSAKERHRVARREATQEDGRKLLTCLSCGIDKPEDREHWHLAGPGGRHPDGSVHWKQPCRKCRNVPPKSDASGTGTGESTT